MVHRVFLHGCCQGFLVRLLVITENEYYKLSFEYFYHIFSCLGYFSFLDLSIIISLIIFFFVLNFFLLFISLINPLIKCDKRFVKKTIMSIELGKGVDI